VCLSRNVKQSISTDIWSYREISYIFSICPTESSLLCLTFWCVVKLFFKLFLKLFFELAVSSVRMATKDADLLICLLTKAPMPCAPLSWDRLWAKASPAFAPVLAARRYEAIQRLFLSTAVTEVSLGSQELQCVSFALETSTKLYDYARTIETVLNEPQDSAILRMRPFSVEWVYSAELIDRGEECQISILNSALTAIEAINCMVAAICVLFDALIQSERITGKIDERGFVPGFQLLLKCCRTLKQWYPPNNSSLLSSSQYHSLFQKGCPLQLHYNWCVFAETTCLLRWQLHNSMRTPLQTPAIRGAYELTRRRHVLLRLWLTSQWHTESQQMLLQTSYDCSLRELLEMKAQWLMHELSALLSDQALTDELVHDRRHIGKMLHELRLTWNLIENNFEQKISQELEQWYTQMWQAQQRANAEICSDEQFQNWSGNKVVQFFRIE